MPFYEYQCDDCGHRFEVMQRITAEPVKVCENCGSKVRRILFPSAIIYKGSGFYATEYGRSTHNNPSKAKKVDLPNSSSSSKESTGTSSSKNDSSSSGKSEKSSSSTSTSAKNSNSKNSAGASSS